jgi:hypothetical protein
MRVFIFAQREGSRREVWLDPDGEYYRAARETGAVTADVEHSFPRNVNWIASAEITEDFDFTLQAPRETR